MSTCVWWGVLCCNPRRNRDDRLLLAVWLLHSSSLSLSSVLSLGLSAILTFKSYLSTHSINLAEWEIFYARFHVWGIKAAFSQCRACSGLTVWRTTASVVSAYFGTREESCPGRKKASDSFSCPFPWQDIVTWSVTTTSTADGFILNPDVNLLWCDLINLFGLYWSCCRLCLSEPLALMDVTA